MCELPLRRGAPKRVEIGDLLPRRDNTESAVTHSEAAQQRLERRIAQLARLRVLQRLEAIEDQQRAALRDKLREPLPLLPSIRGARGQRGITEELQCRLQEDIATPLTIERPVEVALDVIHLRRRPVRGER